LGGQPVVAGFNGAQISSDGGALLLREAERSLKLVQRLAAYIADCAWSVRRIVLQLSSAWPWHTVFRQAAARLMAAV